MLREIVFPSRPLRRLDQLDLAAHKRMLLTCVHLAGLAALAVWAVAAASTGHGEDNNAPAEHTKPVPHALSSAATTDTTATVLPTEWTFGGYGGIAYTHPATVHIKNGDQTDVTVKDFGWIGRPFKAPIYYGLRVQRWTAGRIGGMFDFIHAKAIAKPDDVATIDGEHNGRTLPEKAPIRDVFSKLEFSHGHNILTLNGLLRLAPSWARFRPYVGLGAGITLPHSEVGFRGDNVRTYEYQYAGLAAQLLGGLEIQVGRTAVFLEYKFTYAPYDIPLTHRSPGWLLVTDVWEQIQDWIYGRTPPGGRLRVQLTSHHAVAGVLVKSTAPGSFAPAQ
ncbi:MAG: hypothetical protein AAF732_06055 [Pseudomonadota bacterium]